MSGTGGTRRPPGPSHPGSRWLARGWDQVVELGRPVLAHRVGRILAAAVCLAALIEVVDWRAGQFLIGRSVALMIDLGVYRRAGADVVAGRSIYKQPAGAFPFTYPPFAALFAVVVAWGERQLVQVLWTVANLVVLGAVLFATLRRRFASWDRNSVALLTLAALAVLSLTQPVYENYYYGQVNVFLMALCFFDVVSTSAVRPRGVLVGIAAGVKLVPGIFGLYFLLTGQIRAAVVSGLSFLVTVGLTWAILPADSNQYWLHIVFDTARIGSPTFHRNQSLYGAALRAVSGTDGRALFAIAAIAVAIVGFRRARSLTAQGDLVAAALVVGLIGVLVSPISWTHHLDWVAPVLVLAVLDADRPVLWVWGAVCVAVFSLPVPLDASAFVRAHTGVLRVFGAIGEDAFALLVVALLVTPFRSTRFAPLQPAGDGRTPDRSGRGGSRVAGHPGRPEPVHSSSSNPTAAAARR